MGSFLVVEEDLEDSDIAVILMGSDPDRMMGAVELYQVGCRSYDDFNERYWEREREAGIL